MSDGYTKREIEDALLQALVPLSVRGGGYVHTLRPYRGELTLAGLAQDRLHLPAIFAAWASSTYKPGPCLYVLETMGFNVITIERGAGGPDDFKSLADVRAALCGATLGLDIRPLQLVRETALAADRETAAFASLFTLTQTVRLAAQSQNT